MSARSGLLELCNFPSPGTAVRAGVSGGADSTALVLLAIEAGLAVEVVHVDHGLRPDSHDDADHVVELCRRLSVPVHVERIDLAAGPNLEARARDARRAVLGPDAMLGHTADDQAETVLLHLLRGAGPAGLAGIERSHRHPLLDLRRSDTEKVCADAGVVALVDPMNADPRFRRVRIRHELLPLLDDIAERDVAAVLARHARLHRDVAAHLDQTAASIDARDVAQLRAASRILASTALRRWIRAATGSRHPVDQASIDRVLAVVDGEARAAEVNGGWRIVRSSGRLRLDPAPRR